MPVNELACWKGGNLGKKVRVQYGSGISGARCTERCGINPQELSQSVQWLDGQDEVFSCTATVSDAGGGARMTKRRVVY